MLAKGHQAILDPPRTFGGNIKAPALRNVAVAPSTPQSNMRCQIGGEKRLARIRRPVNNAHLARNQQVLNKIIRRKRRLDLREPKGVEDVALIQHLWRIRNRKRAQRRNNANPVKSRRLKPIRYIGPRTKISAYGAVPHRRRYAIKRSNGSLALVAPSRIIIRHDKDMLTRKELLKAFRPLARISRSRRGAHAKRSQRVGILLALTKHHRIRRH